MRTSFRNSGPTISLTKEIDLYFDLAWKQQDDYYKGLETLMAKRNELRQKIYEIKYGKEASEDS